VRKGGSRVPKAGGGRGRRFLSFAALFCAPARRCAGPHFAPPGRAQHALSLCVGRAAFNCGRPLLFCSPFFSFNTHTLPQTAPRPAAGSPAGPGPGQFPSKQSPGCAAGAWLEKGGAKHAAKTKKRVAMPLFLSEPCAKNSSQPLRRDSTIHALVRIFCFLNVTVMYFSGGLFHF
jgi:hypothetical protein